MELTELRGIGPKYRELLGRLGIETPEDLVRYYPIHYDAYLPPSAIASAEEGQKVSVTGMITAPPSVRRIKGRTILTARIEDPTGSLELVWYNALFLKNLLKPGSEFIFRGVIWKRQNRLRMEHPEVLTKDKYAALMHTLVPVYSLTKGLSGQTIRKAVDQALRIMPYTHEYLPETLIRINDLADEAFALRAIHFPENEDDLQKARKRLAFDEFFLFILTLRRLKEATKDDMSAVPLKKCWETEELIASLPYALTGAQKRVWHEIEANLAEKRPMRRLIQGDVGSGKTILAFLAMLQCAAGGHQSALMAPTEVLARQHFEKLAHLTEAYHLDVLRPILLTGAMTAKEKREALIRIKSGEANAVIGTHALIQQTVEYESLALVITDEQHRFGVHQRRNLEEKGPSPHSIVMSATPIPRTLAVIFYGDLDLSVVDELPARRLPIKNAVVNTSFRAQSMKFIEKQVGEGHQAYVICPMIEPNEELDAADVLDEKNALKKAFPAFTVEALHGRMKAEEKNKVMERFAAGEIDVLVSTTVVEVGVDVPNATLMLIENAERFGLSALHQLRGRVGRGAAQSYCIFMAGSSSDEVMKRLNILKESNNGFEIADRDLELRGPGDLFGIRQSGDLVFHIADITRDREVLKAAGQTADSVMKDDPALISEELSLLRRRLGLYLKENEKNIVL